jgi:uncharacterized repeat protein (TIGR03803 family)
MTKLSAWKMASAVFVLCATTAIAAQAQTLTVLTNFDGTNGAGPVAVTEGIDGKLYGATSAGGIFISQCDGFGNGCGTVFKVTPSGVLTTLYDFCSATNCTDGYDPYGALALATNGSL